MDRNRVTVGRQAQESALGCCRRGSGPGHGNFPGGATSRAPREISCFCCQCLILLCGPNLLGGKSEGLPLSLCTSSQLAFRSVRDQCVAGGLSRHTMPCWSRSAGTGREGGREREADQPVASVNKGPYLTASLSWLSVTCNQKNPREQKHRDTH